MTTTASAVSSLSPSPSPSLSGQAAADDLVAVARAVAADLRGRADRHDREGSYAPENIAAIWAAGLGNLTLPADLGGAGANTLTASKVIETLAMGDASTALIFLMHQIHLRTLSDPRSGWPAHLRRRIIADSLAGPALINALRVEPELGTPARGGVPATTAIRGIDGAGAPVWRLSGRKIYSTGSQGLRWMSVWGATLPEDPEGQRIGFFVVPADTDGIEIVETWDHLGMRASASHDVVFHDVEIPIDDTAALQPLGNPSSPDAAQAGTLARMNVLLLSIYLGVAKAGRDWLTSYLNERKPSNLGAALATLPRFQSAVGEIEALVYTSEQLLTVIAAALDGHGPDAERTLQGAALAKVVVTTNVIQALEQAMALIGNPGLTLHHPLQRHYRDALCSRIHTPQNDVLLTVAGRAALNQ